MNRFAHLKAPVEEETEIQVPATEPVTTPNTTAAPNAVTQSESAPAATGSPRSTELEEVMYLVERRIGIVGKIPASLKDSYDEMVLRSRKYIGRPNADLAVQAWVELTLEDETFRHLWLKRIQELKK